MIDLVGLSHVQSGWVGWLAYLPIFIQSPYLDCLRHFSFKATQNEKSLNRESW